MWLSRKPNVLIPFSLFMIGFRIVTHQGSLLGVRFPLTYEVTALLGVVIWAHDTWSCCSHLGLKRVNWEWPSSQNCLRWNSWSPALPPPQFFTPSFQLLRPKILVLRLTSLFYIPHLVYWKILWAPPSNDLYSFTVFSFLPLVPSWSKLPLFLAWVTAIEQCLPRGFYWEAVRPGACVHIWHHIYLGEYGPAYQQRGTNVLLPPPPRGLGAVLVALRKEKSSGVSLAQLVEQAALDLRDVSSSPMLGLELTLKQNLYKKKTRTPELSYPLPLLQVKLRCG